MHASFDIDSLTLSVGETATINMTTYTSGREMDGELQFNSTIISVTPTTFWYNYFSTTYTLQVTALANGTTNLVPAYNDDGASLPITVATPSDPSVLVKTSSLQNIADAIRNKNGSSDTYLPSEMATAISNIPSGGATTYSITGTTTSGTIYVPSNGVPNDIIPIVLYNSSDNNAYQYGFTITTNVTMTILNVGVYSPYNSHAYYFTMPTKDVNFSFVPKTTCCFSAGTQILMNDNTTKNIEDVQVGEIVKTYNEITGEIESGEVKHFIIHTGNLEIARVTLEDGKTVTMNSYHPLYTQDGWKSLTNYEGYPTLTENDKIRTSTNELVQISSIELYNEEDAITYNLDIEENDNYFANGMLASNPPCATGDTFIYT